MDKQPATFDYIAWWTSIPGIPAGWPEPAPTRSRVIELPVTMARPEPADRDEYPAAA